MSIFFIAALSTLIFAVSGCVSRQDTLKYSVKYDGITVVEPSSDICLDLASGGGASLIIEEK